MHHPASVPWSRAQSCGTTGRHGSRGIAIRNTGRRGHEVVDHRKVRQTIYNHFLATRKPQIQVALHTNSRSHLSRHGAGPQTESDPLTGLGEPAEHFKSRSTYIARDICLRSLVTPDLVSLGLFACSKWVPSRPPLPDHHPRGKAATFAKTANRSAPLCDRFREHMPFRIAD